MSELRTRYLREDILNPVKLAVIERWDGDKLEGAERVEVSFRESSPENRNALAQGLLLGLTLASLMAALMGLNPIVVMLFLGEEAGAQSAIGPMFWGGVAGGVVFAFCWKYARPPFYGPVKVVMEPASDLVSIYRHGKLAGEVPLTEVRGAALEPHPGLEDARVKAEANPKMTGFRKLVDRYRQAKMLYLTIGRGMTEMKVEVAAFRESASSQLPLRARAATEQGRDMAMQYLRQHVGKGGEPGRKRRRRKSRDK